MPRVTRELRKLATELGINTNQGYNEIDVALTRHPATDAQLALLAKIVAVAGRQLPDNLSASSAHHAIMRSLPALNDLTLRAKGWQQGQILRWQDDYYYIYDVTAQGILALQPVALVAVADGPAKTEKIKRGKEWQHAYVIADEAEAVDLDTWQPQPEV